MTTVWILLNYTPHEATDLEGIFSTREKAINALQKRAEEGGYHMRNEETYQYGDAELYIRQEKVE